MADSEWMEWVPSIWGTKVEVQSDFVDNLQGGVLSADEREAIISEIKQSSNNAGIVDIPSVGEGVEFNGFGWSTSMDFGHEYEGGGYSLYFGHEDVYDGYGLPVPLLVVNVESDSYSEEAGYDRGQWDCVEIALDVLEEFLSSL